MKFFLLQIFVAILVAVLGVGAHALDAYIEMQLAQMDSPWWEDSLYRAGVVWVAGITILGGVNLVSVFICFMIWVQDAEGPWMDVQKKVEEWM